MSDKLDAPPPATPASVTPASATPAPRMTADPGKLPVREHIFFALANRIRNGSIPAGTQLVERRVAEELGVSRMSLRDAFHLLEAEGLITIVPRRGAFVCALNGTPTPTPPPDLSDIDPVVTGANRVAVDRINLGQAVFTSIRRAADVIPALNPATKTLLHAGPPIAINAICGTMLGACIGAILFEGWARNADEAQRLLHSGEIRFESNHDHNCVAPMAGIISPSMAVMVVANPRFGVEAYAPLSAGGPRTIGMGAHNRPVIEKLRWLNTEFASVLSQVLESSGGIDLHSLIVEGLQMGDELHNITKASTLLLLREVAAPIAQIGGTKAVRALEHLTHYEDLFLGASMAASNAMLIPARNIADCSLVTAIARNGVDFGIRVSGLGDTWFTAPSPFVSGVFYPGFGPEDADRDIGDSAIVETIGLGAFAGAASPLISRMVGGSVDQFVEISQAMSQITIARHESFKIPAMNFAGSPLGIDIRKVVRTGITPFIDTAISHRQAGTGQIGSGVSQAPMACFDAAVTAFNNRHAH